MHPSDDEDKEKSNSIDKLSDVDLDHIFDRMHHFFKSDEFKDLVEDIVYEVLSDDEDETSFYKPSFEDRDVFSDQFEKNSFLIDDGLFESSMENTNPEFFTSKNLVMVTISLPQAKKNDIDLHVTRDYIDITVNNRHHRLHRMIDLPVDVDPCSTKATFTNGVLDIVMRKMSSHNQGYKISLS